MTEGSLCHVVTRVEPQLFEGHVEGQGPGPSQPRSYHLQLCHLGGGVLIWRIEIWFRLYLLKIQ